jgi:hypothetical protein
MEEGPVKDKLLEYLKAVPFRVKFIVKVYLDHIEKFIPEHTYPVYGSSKIQKSPYIYADWRELIY